MLRGFVVKTYNSYYYVQTGNTVTMCTLRGRLKKERFLLLVGDEVEYSMHLAGKGVVEEILPRRSMLKKPMVANVNQVVLTFAAVNPDISTILLDRFLILAELSELNIIICINKIDLAEMNHIQQIVDTYRKIGYPVLLLSAREGLGVEELRKLLSQRITVFAGPSGAGKSTLLNIVEPGLTLATGIVSEKIGRGKHTTRFAELLPLAQGGFVVDTPGFSFTEFNDFKETELMYCFPEMVRFVPQCKFNSCLHFKEPDCAVKQAVAEGLIHTERYKSYIETLKELKDNKKGY